MSGVRAVLKGHVGAFTVDVALEVASGALALVGPNGAGKTSVLQMILGARELSDGRVEVSGKAVFDRAARVNVPMEDRRLGYVPQDYALFPHLNVRQNVAFGARADVDALMTQLMLTELGSRSVHTLSGGERQRVALARALAAKPVALLLDEPLAALDVRAIDEVRVFLKATLQTLGIPTILVTHDATDARVLSDRIAVLEAGRLTQVGSYDELAANPATEFVRRFTRSAR